MNRIWKGVEAFEYYKSKLPEEVKPVSQEAKEFFIQGYNEALSDNNFTVVGLLEEDFASHGFKRYQFSEEVIAVMLNDLNSLYLETKWALERALAKEIIRKEAADLKLKPML